MWKYNLQSQDQKRIIYDPISLKTSRFIYDVLILTFFLQFFNNAYINPSVSWIFRNCFVAHTSIPCYLIFPVNLTMVLSTIFRAGEPANFLAAPAPDFFPKRPRLLVFFSSGSGSKGPKTPGSDRLRLLGKIVFSPQISKVKLQKNIKQVK